MTRKRTSELARSSGRGWRALRTCSSRVAGRRRAIRGHRNARSRLGTASKQDHVGGGSPSASIQQGFSSMFFVALKCWCSGSPPPVLDWIPGACRSLGTFQSGGRTKRVSPVGGRSLDVQSGGAASTMQLEHTLAHTYCEYEAWILAVAADGPGFAASAWHGADPIQAKRQVAERLERATRQPAR